LTRTSPARSRVRAGLFTVVFAAVCLLAVSSVVFAARSVEHAKTWVAGVWMHVVTVDLNAPAITVTPAVSRKGIGSSESFRSMMRRTRPAAAINGTFFDTRTLKPTGDIVIGGRLLRRGELGVAIGVNAGRFVSFIPSRHSDLYCWSDYESVMVAGPTLIAQGRIAVVPKDEGFRSRVHFSKHCRAAVGLTSANKLVFVTTLRSTYYSRVAKAMKAMNCVEAAVLDGGSSIGLYCHGKLISNPKRGMTNCLLVYDDLYAFQRRRSALCPGNYDWGRLSQGS